MRPRLIVVGELNPDIIVTGVPAERGRLRFQQAEDLVTSMVLTLGSSAAITASAAASAGADVTLVAVIGDDDLGHTCLRWVCDRGVDVTSVRVVPDVPTGSSVILVSRDDPGDRQILTHLGAMAELRVDDVTDDLLSSATHVHVASFFMHTAAREGLHERFAAARMAGATTSLDTNDDPTSEWSGGAHELLAESDVLFCNDREALGLARHAQVQDASGAVDVLLTRLNQGRRRSSDDLHPAVVHKEGEFGATVVTHRGRVHVAASAVDVVDTVGAGDTLAGTVLAHLLAGADWTVALAHGVAAATLSTTGAGGTGAQPDKERTQQLAAELAVTDSRSERDNP